MTDKSDLNDTELEAFFAAARASDPVPSGDLLARVMADAQSVVDASVPVAAAPPRRGLWRMLVAAIGGWGAVAGLATATMAGVGVGYVVPGAISGYSTTGTAVQTTYDLTDVGGSFYALASEGEVDG